MSDAARVEGLRAEVERLKATGSNVVVVALSMSAFEKVAGALAPHEPLLCRDQFERGALRQRLESGGAVAIAMPAALPSESKPGSHARCELLIYGRNNARSADDAIVRSAAALGADVRATFHLSLDDALLQQHVKSLKPILEKLGLSPAEPVTSPYLTRAIANAQNP